MEVCTHKNLQMFFTPKNENDLDTVKEAEEHNKALDDYFKIFAFTEGKCPGCERDLGGLLGSFMWGICNGEGFCSNCGHHCRAIHRPQLDGEMLFNKAIPMILPYIVEGNKIK